VLLSPVMRAYKFLDARFGLKSLYERRLKQSRLHELNDPFELTPYNLILVVVQSLALADSSQLHTKQEQ
jgi:hypothetical protein